MVTEAEWLDAAKPLPCQEIARDFGTTRKLRLLMVGFLEPVRNLLSPAAAEVLDRLRDWAETEDKLTPDLGWWEPGGALADFMQWNVASRAADAVNWVVSHGSKLVARWSYSVAMPAAELDGLVAQTLALNKVGRSPQGVSIMHPSHRAWSQAWNDELRSVRAHLTDVMRCVYGNPFRQVPFDPLWRTPTTVAMAQAIYEERSFAQMTVLADALEEAGCNRREILGHCRTSGPHARGCWVLDSMLQRA